MKIRILFFVKPVLISIILVSTVSIAAAQNEQTFTLQELVQQAKDNSPRALQAKTQRENSYWRYRLFKSNYNPQLRLTGTIPQYYQEYNNITQPDGSIEFIEVKQNLMDLGLGLEQVIGATGGTVSVNTSTNRFDNFLTNPGTPQTRYSGVPISVALQQPIFAYNRFKWDKKIEPLLFEESKREYVQDMEDDLRACAEFNRVLRPSGWGILQSPVYPIEKTLEDKNVSDPAERERLFGQRDHVRKFGSDYAKRLRKSGIEIEENHFVKEISPDVVKKNALPSEEVIFVCRKGN